MLLANIGLSLSGKNEQYQLHFGAQTECEKNIPKVISTTTTTSAGLTAW